MPPEVVSGNGFTPLVVLPQSKLKVSSPPEVFLITVMVAGCCWLVKVQVTSDWLAAGSFTLYSNVTVAVLVPRSMVVASRSSPVQTRSESSHPSGTLVS